jgi:hypothetical protein
MGEVSWVDIMVLLLLVLCMIRRRPTAMVRYVSVAPNQPTLRYRNWVNTDIQQPQHKIKQHSACDALNRAYAKSGELNRDKIPKTTETPRGE